MIKSERIADAKDIGRRVVVEADGDVEIEVRDTGPGIPEPLASQLFEAFVSSKEAGMGLGLVISRDIVESHGGRLWLAGNTAGRCAFRFTLPAHRGVYRNDFQELASQIEFDKLLALPSSVFELDGQSDGQSLRSADYATAGHIATGHSDLLLAVWVLLYSSFTLFTPSLLDDADSVHAEVAREILLRHDWVTLYANGIRYLEKAPLLYWSMAASFKIFGTHTFAARLPLAFTVLALALAAGWQLTAFKQRALRDCHRTVPLPPNGRAATIGVARFGLVNGSACVRCCWPAMLAMAVVPGAQMLLWTALLAGLMTAEKVARRPKLTARVVAIVLGLRQR